MGSPSTTDLRQKIKKQRGEHNDLITSPIEMCVVRGVGTEVDIEFGLLARPIEVLFSAPSARGFLFDHLPNSVSIQTMSSA